MFKPYSWHLAYMAVFTFSSVLKSFLDTGDPVTFIYFTCALSTVSCMGHIPNVYWWVMGNFLMRDLKIEQSINSGS